MYSVGMVIQSFTMDALHSWLGSKKTYILGTCCGAVVAGLAISLNYLSTLPFIIIACTLRAIDGARETQFEVAAFVYFAENVLECTTEKMQGNAISVYKAVGSMGFLIGALQGPFFLSYLGYDGSWCFFLGIYVIAVTLVCFIYPEINDKNSQSNMASQPAAETTSDLAA